MQASNTIEGANPGRPGDAKPPVLIYSNGATANYTYDNTGRLTSLIHRTERGMTIDSFSYTHDNEGNRLSRTEPKGKTLYGYDNIYLLLSAVSAKLPHWRGAKERETYCYDPVGNRLTGPDNNISYLYNRANQLTEQTGRWEGPFPEIRHHGQAEHDKTEYSYDKNGNLINKVEPEWHHHKTVTLYCYDYENRLIEVKTQRGHHENVVSFTYDPFGRRLSKKVEKEDMDDDDRDGRGCHHDRHAPSSAYYVYDGQRLPLQ